MGGKGSGGKREGSGRTKETPTHSMSIRLTDHEHETLRQRAKAARLTVSEYWKMKCIGGTG